MLVTQSADCVTRPAMSVTQFPMVVTHQDYCVTRPGNLVTQPAGRVTQNSRLVTQTAMAVTHHPVVVTHAGSRVTQPGLPVTQLGMAVRIFDLATAQTRMKVTHSGIEKTCFESAEAPAAIGVTLTPGRDSPKAGLLFRNSPVGMKSRYAMARHFLSLTGTARPGGGRQKAPGVSPYRQPRTHSVSRIRRRP